MMEITKVEPSAELPYKIVYQSPRMIVMVGEVEPNMHGYKLGFLCQGCVHEGYAKSIWWHIHPTDKLHGFNREDFYDFMNLNYPFHWFFDSDEENEGATEGLMYCPRCLEREIEEGDLDREELEEMKI